MGEADLSGRRVLVISSEQIGARMAGPAIRAANIAHQYHRCGAVVTLATPREIDEETKNSELLSGLEFQTFGKPSGRTFKRLAQQQEIVFTQPQRVDIAHALSRSGALIIYDLYVPSFVERIAQLANDDGFTESQRRDLLERDRLEYAAAIRLGDAFVCASEKQKDHWLGALGQAGRLELNLIERDPQANRMIGVVPFGVSEPAPVPVASPVLRGRLVAEDAIILLWTGGLWNWFNPTLVVEALARARQKEPRLQLVFMGMHHPEAAWVEQDASIKMRKRANELNLLTGGIDAGVVLCDEWIPYAQRGAFLLEADLGVSAHIPGLETRFSFRTRFLDHLWCGLPTITSDGDQLSTLMAERGAALQVPHAATPCDETRAWVDAFIALADEASRKPMRAAASDLGQEFLWKKTVQSLLQISQQLLSDNARAPRRSLHLLELFSYLFLLVKVRISTKGIASLLRVFKGDQR